MSQPPRETPAPHLDEDGLPPLFDTGNTMLNTEEPAQLIIGKIPVPGGEKGVVTIRTRTTTLTVTLDKAGAADWRDTMAELHDQLPEPRVLEVPSAGETAAVIRASRNGNGRR